jgi:murein DD-endopeptidase MepM/ murein hydrolase activator NlpD
MADDTNQNQSSATLDPKELSNGAVFNSGTGMTFSDEAREQVAARVREKIQELGPNATREQINNEMLSELGNGSEGIGRAFGEAAKDAATAYKTDQGGFFNQLVDQELKNQQVGSLENSLAQPAGVPTGESQQQGQQNQDEQSQQQDQQSEDQSSDTSGDDSGKADFSQPDKVNTNTGQQQGPAGQTSTSMQGGDIPEGQDYSQTKRFDPSADADSVKTVDTTATPVEDGASKVDVSKPRTNLSSTADKPSGVSVDSSKLPTRQVKQLSPLRGDGATQAGKGAQSAGSKVASGVKEGAGKAASAAKKASAEAAKRAAQATATAAKAATQAAISGATQLAAAAVANPVTAGVIAVIAIILFLLLFIFVGAAGAAVTVYCKPEEVPLGSRLALDQIVDKEIRRLIEESCGIQECGPDGAFLSGTGVGADFCLAEELRGKADSDTIPFWVPDKASGGLTQVPIRVGVIREVLVNAPDSETAAFTISVHAIESRGAPDPWTVRNRFGYTGIAQVGNNERVVWGSRVTARTEGVARTVSVSEFQTNRQLQMLIIQEGLREKEGFYDTGVNPDICPRYIAPEPGAKSDIYKAAYSWITLCGVDGNGTPSAAYAEAAELNFAIVTCQSGKPSEVAQALKLRPVYDIWMNEVGTYVQSAVFGVDAYANDDPYRWLRPGNAYDAESYRANNGRYTRGDSSGGVDIVIGNDPSDGIGVPLFVQYPGVVTYTRTGQDSFRKGDRPSGSYGNQVAVYFPELDQTVIYSHLDSVAVNVGDQVGGGSLQNSLIGTQGDTGSSVGSDDGGRFVHVDLRIFNGRLPDNASTGSGLVSDLGVYSDFTTSWLEFYNANEDAIEAGNFDVIASGTSSSSGVCVDRDLVSQCVDVEVSRVKYLDREFLLRVATMGGISAQAQGDTDESEDEDDASALADPCRFDGSFINPAPDFPTTSPFGGRTSPGGIGSSNHKGQDIGTPQGTPIIASAAGKVTVAGDVSGYGGAVYIDHGKGFTTRYAHLSRIDVSIGDTVGQGDTIALSGGQPGTTGAGTSTGPHLHFEIRVNGVAQDPRNYVQF